MTKIATCEIFQRQLVKSKYINLSCKHFLWIFIDFSEILRIFTEKKLKCKKFHWSQLWSDFIFRDSFGILSIRAKKLSSALSQF